MKRSISAGLAVVGGAALWWVMPTETKNGQISLADLGPREACACAAAVSPPQQKWANCSVKALDAVGRLDNILIASDRYWRKPPTAKDATRFAAAIKEAERKCGTFDQAYGKASELQKRRLAAGYEEYELVEAEEVLFAGRTADGLRSEAGIPSMRHGNN